MDDKVGRLPSCGKQSRAFSGLVARATVLFWVLHIVLNWSEPDDRHFAVELGLKICNLEYLRESNRLSFLRRG
jgi:hypothetical protein